jgi:hypothetical protein
MHNVFYFLYQALPFFHAITIICMIAKAMIVRKNKELTMSSYVWSFFRIYSLKEMNKTQSRNRLKFMMFNNFINYYIYLWAFITILIFIIFSSSDTGIKP